MNFPIVDALIAVFVIWAIINGIKRGFLESLLKFFSFILSLLLAFLLAEKIINISGNWLGIQVGGVLTILDSVFNLIIIIILFSIFEIIFGFLEKRIIRNKPVVGSEVAGKILGLSIGFLKAIILVLVFLMLIWFLFPGENFITLQIERSIVGKYLFEKNPLPILVQLSLA